MKIMQKKVKMLVDGEDKKESQNPVANSLNKSTNKKVVNHHYKFYNIKNKKCEQKKKKTCSEELTFDVVEEKSLQDLIAHAIGEVKL